MIIRTLLNVKYVGCIGRIVRPFSTEVLYFKTEYSEENQEKILNILNQSPAEQLLRYNVTQSRVKSLEQWKQKNGRFQTLHEVLEVEGLGEKVLQKICESIITGSDGLEPVKGSTEPGGNNKSRKHILTPALPLDFQKSLENAVGIHLAPTGVSWAKLTTKRNELADWNFHHFTDLPKKLLPTDTFQLATTIMQKVPFGDIYVMEAAPPTSPSSKVPSYSQQIELSSMLLALLNTHPRHAPNAIQGLKDEVYLNKVYFLKSNLPARLFRTLVGNEKVAATETMKKLLGGQHNLPCTVLSVPETVVNVYNSQPSIYRNVMSQSLLLIITFMDLCVYRNATSFAAITPNRR